MGRESHVHVASVSGGIVTGAILGTSEPLNINFSPLPGQDGAVLRSILPGGVRLLTEHMAHVRSASVGLWIPVGSRDEADGHFGSTHFLEHLLFKGTSRRDAQEIAEAFDKVGGEANAATTKEHTCYHARVLDADLPMAIDVLADMVAGALLDSEEFELERGVILEELAMTQDDPHDIAHEAFAAAVFGDSPLARPIAGTPETIRSVPRDAVIAHYRQHYLPDSLIVTAAGNVDHGEVARLVTDALGRAGWQTAADAVPRPMRSSTPTITLPAEPSQRVVTRTVEQTQVIVGCEGLRTMDERRHAMGVLSTVLGGGMSSRLFQEIRERRGLAYSTYSFSVGHADAGCFGLFAGCAANGADEVTGLLSAEWDKLAAHGVDAQELARAKGQIRGGLVLGMEDPFSRMARLGRSEIITGELPPLDELLARVEQVTADDVADLAADLASRPRHEVRVTPT
ncbi:MAG: insulinase family protein [Bifidobacteriaceae bacterium]|nr:insulinase family protein [Bifidobacteriaceae bacterium]